VCGDEVLIHGEGLCAMGLLFTTMSLFSSDGMMTVHLTVLLLASDSVFVRL